RSTLKHQATPNDPISGSRAYHHGAPKHLTELNRSAFTNSSSNNYGTSNSESNWPPIGHPLTSQLIPKVFPFQSHPPEQSMKLSLTICFLNDPCLDIHILSSATSNASPRKSHIFNRRGLRFCLIKYALRLSKKAPVDQRIGAIGHSKRAAL